MAERLTARWGPWKGDGLEVATIEHSSRGFEARGEVSAEPGAAAWARYTITGDAEWRTRAATLVLADGRRVDLACDGAGTWTVDGLAAPHLTGAVDVDLSGTPLTNTLPIRRLGLAVGARARIHCAYVDLPSLGVRLEAQTYIRLADSRYHFQSAAHGFARDIDVDEHGLVVSYPGLFRRVG